MAFDTSKNLSGIGALLLFIAPLALLVSLLVGGFLALIGIILLLVGVKGLADYYREAGIFNNILYGTLLEIIGVVVAAASAIILVFSTFIDILNKVFPGWGGDWAKLSSMTPVTTNLTLGDFIPFLTAALLVLVIIFVFTILETLFYRRSFSSLKDKSGIGLFGTTGLVWLIGAVLTIILIGYLIIWIAVLILAIAFFQLRPQPVQSMPPAQTMPPPPPP